MTVTTTMMSNTSIAKLPNGNTSQKKTRNLRRSRSSSDPLNLQRRSAMMVVEQRQNKSLRKLEVDDPEEDDYAEDETETDMTESEHSPSFASFSLHGSSHGSIYAIDLHNTSQEEPDPHPGVVHHMARAQRRKSDFISSLVDHRDHTWNEQHNQQPRRRAKLHDPEDQQEVACPTTPKMNITRSSSPPAVKLKHSTRDTKSTPHRSNYIPLHQERLQQAKQRMLVLNQSLQDEMSLVEEKWRCATTVATESTSDDPMVLLEMVQKGIPFTISWEKPNPPKQRMERRRSSSLPPLGGREEEEPFDDNASPNKKTRRGRKKNNNKADGKASKSKKRESRSQSKNQRQKGHGKMERRRSNSLPPPPPPPFQERADAPPPPRSRGKQPTSSTQQQQQQRPKKRRDGLKKSRSSPHLSLSSSSPAKSRKKSGGTKARKVERSRRSNSLPPPPKQKASPKTTQSRSHKQREKASGKERKQIEKRKPRKELLVRSQSSPHLTRRNGKSTNFDRQGSARLNKTKSSDKKKNKQQKPQRSKGHHPKDKKPSTKETATATTQLQERVLTEDKLDRTKHQLQKQYEEMMAFAEQCQQARQQLEATRLWNNSSSPVARSRHSLPHHVPVRPERRQHALDRASSSTNPAVRENHQEWTSGYREQYQKSHSLHW